MVTCLWYSMSRLEFKFFQFISKLVGMFFCVDDDTRSQGNMDIARTLMRTSCNSVLNEVLKARLMIFCLI